VEVLSPSNSYIDRVTKKEIYAAHGIPELWLVDPQSKQLEIYLPNVKEPYAVFNVNEIVNSYTIKNLEFKLEFIFNG